MRNKLKKIALLLCLLIATGMTATAQELEAKIIVNSNQIQGTDKAVFDNLQQTLEQFVNDHQWTNLQFQKNERIGCSFNITITKYNRESNLFTCSAMIQATRPVYNSAYTTTIFSIKDNEFSFPFAQFDQLEFNEEIIDNQLTALIGYYALLIIGINLDTFAPMGGEDVLQRCMNLTNNAQSLDFPGWKSFDSDKNRFAIINDYLDPGMKPFRQLQYDYYRQGLDEMAANVERGRTNITTALEEQLKKCHEDKPLSMVPQLWTEYKRDELANIYKSKGTQKEKQTVHDILFNINPSLTTAWNKIME